MNESRLEKNEKGFFGKLSNGDFGLAKTYWIYGILVGIGANIISNFINSVGFLVLFIVACTAYEIPVILGVWRSSSKYNGLKLWAILAKISVVLWVITLIAAWLIVFGLLTQA